jgi:hypothetical protein
MLDALVMLAVESRTETAPPAGAADGARYVVADAPTGAWTGEAGKVAALQDGAWAFFAPAEGWFAWCAAEQCLLCFAGGAWVATGLGAGAIQNLGRLGVNATADATNRLAVAADAALFSHAGGSHRLTVNKHAASDTASLLFQDDYAGRAEIGLVGDDSLVLKVSADGSTFREAMRVDGTTGKPSFPAASFIENYALNLYQDSGRFAGNGVSSAQLGGGFAFPAYLTLYNGAAAAGLGKFISDNSDYGGAAGSMAPAVKDLVDMIRDASVRRYGVEFWVAEITAGSVTDPASALTVGGETGYYSLFGTFKARPPALTFHAYLRALDDDIFIQFFPPGQAALKNGVAQAASFALTPAEGWVSLTITDVTDPYGSVGYQPSILNVYAKTAGNRYLLACPALMAGITPVDDNIGVVAAFNGWEG